MTIKFQIPKGHDSICARLVGAIVQVIQEFNGEHPTDIFLVYGDKKVDAMSILNWLEFSIHDHRDFRLVSEISDLTKIESAIYELFEDFEYKPSR